MCWKCGKEIKVTGIITRNDVCPACDTDVRCCKNCKFFEPGSHYDCHESIDEIVVDKERSNFCDFFSLNNIVYSKEPTNYNSKSKARDAETSAATKARDAFNSLFGD